MPDKLLIDAYYEEETRIAIIDEGGVLLNFETEHNDSKLIKGNVYLAKIERIEPSIQAAFIDYGDEKHGFLPFSEVQHDYYNKNIVKSTESEGEENRNYKIQEVLHHGQVVLVQAIREKRGNKCAAFSTFIGLPGRYCVLVSKANNSSKSGGISKKIDASDKARLREIIDSLESPEEMNVIIRTAGENKTKQEIKKDFDYLLRLWGNMKKKVVSSKAPLLIYEEGNIVKRAIRDLYSKKTEKIIIQGENAYKEARAFMKTFSPSHARKIELYNGNTKPIFSEYGIEEKIGKIMETTVSLPSGGSIVINTVEALTAIDVNSGRMKHEKDIDNTAFKSNMEAAVEVARQIRLRDIAGIIVIDFIDMSEPSFTLKVEKKFKECMGGDYSNTQIGKISQFGLLEISRQRLRQSLSDVNFVMCKHCNGAGRILSNETIGMSIIRQIETFLLGNTNVKAILVEVSSGIDSFILNAKRKVLIFLENKYNVAIEIIENRAISFLECKIVIKEFKEITKMVPQGEKISKKLSNIDTKTFAPIVVVTEQNSEKSESIGEVSKVKSHNKKRRRKKKFSEQQQQPSIQATENAVVLPKKIEEANAPLTTKKKSGWIKKIFK
ncbi:MAG: ribonuclease E/G [Holosporales bacterium]|jgi:ribonuclease E|nr:ribonuclease E/G [Holosporales bacterium]